MARVLLDCEPICGRPWRISLADQAWEREEVFRLRYEVFNREQGYGAGEPAGGAAGAAASAAANDSSGPGRDADSFDEWCEHLMLRDEARGELIGTYRLIPGPAAVRHGGFYSGTEFDLSPMDRIAPEVLEVGRTCVAPQYRNGLAMQFLWYGLELVLKSEGYRYLLGCGSFSADTPDELNRIYSWSRRHAADPEFFCPVLPRCAVPELREVETSADDEKLLPPLIQHYLKLGSSLCSPPAWDPDFRTYDFLILFRRNQTSEYCAAFLSRMERQLRVMSRRLAGAFAGA
jgi:putative hemolysin